MQVRQLVKYGIVVGITIVAILGAQGLFARAAASWATEERSCVGDVASRAEVPPWERERAFEGYSEDDDVVERSGPLLAAEERRGAERWHDGPPWADRSYNHGQEYSHKYGHKHGLGIFRGLSFLAGLGLIGLGGWVLWKNRRDEPRDPPPTEPGGTPA